MKKSFYLLLAAAAAFGVAVPASSAVYAQATKSKPAPAKPDRLSIAVIDMQFIIRESAAMKGVREEIAQLREKFQAEVTGEEGRFREERTKLVRQRGVLTPQAFGRRRNQLVSKFAAVQRRLQAKSRSLEAASAATLRDFQKSLFVVVEELAKERGYTLVLTRARVPYAHPTYLATDEVLKRLNAKLPVLKLQMAEPNKVKVKPSEKN
ncbi:MAG TPA: OmpH family outer membrane protein [Alphaproteobacteria bacterium]|nr:OmpH family outer membrane protein [Alphaproteobacteria bacterium]